MPSSMSQTVTRLLSRASDGDASALDELLPLVYEELRELAARSMRRERVGHTLQGTALVHEAWLRLVGQRDVDWSDRRHFFAVAATQIRRVLVDHARAHRAAKRGGERARVPLEHAELGGEVALDDVLSLDEALSELAAFDERKSRVVELRYFAGLSIDESAAALDVSHATIEREWALARAWLKQRLEGHP